MLQRGSTVRSEVYQKFIGYYARQGDVKSEWIGVGLLSINEMDHLEFNYTLISFCHLKLCESLKSS